MTYRLRVENACLLVIEQIFRDLGPDTPAEVYVLERARDRVVVITNTNPVHWSGEHQRTG